MALDLADVRSGLASALASLTSWETYATWPDNPHPPCVIVQPGDATYHEAMQAGLTVVDFGLVLLVSSTVTDEAQTLLDELLSSGTGQASSVIDTLQGSTLGGVCKQVHVVGWSEYGAVQMPDERRFFGVVVNVQVHCDRK